MTLRKNKREPDAYDEPEEDAGEAARNSHPIRSFLVFLLFMVAAVLLFGALAARTGGFREIISVKSADWFQARLAIRESRIAFPYDLVLNDVRVPAQPANDPWEGLLIREVRVSWRPFRGLRVRLDKPELHLRQTAPGSFAPAELEGLGCITNAAGIVDWLAPVNRRASLFIQDGTIALRDADGKDAASIEALRLTVLPVSLPGRPGVHYRLETGSLKRPDAGYESLTQEWLSMDGAPVVEIAFDVKGATAPWGRHFWKGNQP